MMSALPMTPDRGMPPETLLAMVMRSGSTPEYSTANIRPVRAEPGLDLIDNQQYAVLVAQGPQLAQQLRRRLVEAAFSQHGLDDDRGHARRIDIGLEQSIQRLPTSPPR